MLTFPGKDTVCGMNSERSPEHRKRSRAIASSNRPRYIEIKEAIRQSISDGEYAISQALPSENTLTRKFGVSRVTVRHALSELQKERLIFSRHGKGHFVARPIVVQSLSRLLGLGETAESRGFRIRSEVLSAKVVKAHADIAAGLQVASGTDVFEIKRLRFMNDKPLSLDLSYFPAEIGQRLADCDLVNTDVFVLLERELDIELGLADIKIRLSPAPDDVASALETETGDATLHITRLTSTTDGDPVDFEYIYGRGDAFQFQVTVARC